MTRNAVEGPSELVLMASVARRYYLDGLSKIDIAEQLDLSRFKVARLLEKARATGVVRIEIGYPGVVDVDLSSRLRDAYSLRRSVVIEAPARDPAALRAHLGQSAAELLTEIVTSDDVLGLAWARSLSAMSTALTRLACCDVVQLTGALTTTDPDNSTTDLVREVARVGGGAAYRFYAPMIVSKPATATALRQQPDVARAIGRFGGVTKALVGIGGWLPGHSTVYDCLEPAERQALERMGVRAEISGIPIDREGHPVDTPLGQRTIGVTAPQLRAIPEVIGLAYSEPKEAAVRAALRGGLINGLVTHSELARLLLDGETTPTAPPRGGAVQGDLGASHRAR